MKRGFLNGLRPHLAVTPSPLSPSPERGRGGIVREASPLYDSPISGEFEGRNKYGEFKRGAAPLPKTSPSPSKERGTKGVR